MHHISSVEVLNSQKKVIDQGLGLEFVDLVLLVAEQLLEVEIEELHHQVDFCQLVALALSLDVGKGVKEIHSELVVFLSAELEQDL